nr:MAG TPA: hypothetical protein [Caudoviricetes sp.]
MGRHLIENLQLGRNPPKSRGSRRHHHRPSGRPARMAALPRSALRQWAHIIPISGRRRPHRRDHRHRPRSWYHKHLPHPGRYGHHHPGETRIPRPPGSIQRRHHPKRSGQRLRPHQRTHR